MKYYMIRIENSYRAIILAGPLSENLIKDWKKEVEGNEQHCYDKEHIVLVSVVNEWDRTK